MIRFYRKNELLFAILCIVGYVLVFGNLRSLGDDSPAMTIGLLVFSALLFLFVSRNDLMDTYGLTDWPSNARKMLYFVPLWFLSTGNLWAGVSPRYQGIGLLCAIVSFALVGFVEELIFRGFLFKAMLKDGKASTAIIVSSVTFGMGHIVNLFNGHASFETVLQMVFAISMGFIFTFVYYKSGSLLPGILAHSAIDVFSVFAKASTFSLLDQVYLGLTFVVAVLYCGYLMRVETPAINQFPKGE